MARPNLTKVHMFLMAIVAVAAVIIAGIGFLGSYTAVRELAVQQGFGSFSALFPIGVDVGIIALLALDLLLSWLRIPFFLLRQTAWLLTAATIAMNAASAWPHPLGVGMHAVIPLLFVVIAEAGRHAISRLAKLTGSRRMESVRFMRWVLSPVRTFAMWRRMMLWELRSVDEAVRLEQMRLAYAMLLEDAYGKDWAKAAPRSAILPLRLAKLGVPIYTTAPQGLAAAGLSDEAFGSLFSGSVPAASFGAGGRAEFEGETHEDGGRRVVPTTRHPEAVGRTTASHDAGASGDADSSALPSEVGAAEAPTTGAGPQAVGPGEPRPDAEHAAAELVRPTESPVESPAPEEAADPVPAGQSATPTAGLEEGQSREDQLYSYYCRYIERHGQHPEKHLFADFIYREFGQTGQSGTAPVSVQSLRRYWGNLEARYRDEFGAARPLEGAAK
ncbi:DUF2637 domain-containing protein [Kitasatospora sp. NE20-6]|uniref:DUF2637 domain-containing protein n=1 Tax=Kitasatospora sp. NE20-6 TaxID=2859066 RepID=UPI0038B2CF2F